MTENLAHFDEFHGQTRLKHFVLESYLETWARISLQQGIHPSAWFIDAFAGAGKDKHGNPGSPLIACRVSRRLAGYLETRLPAPLPELRIVAIEERPATFKRLRAATDAFTREIGGNCLELRQSRLGLILPEIFALGDPTDPKLFFLDPFGVRGLDAEVSRAILQRPKYEILALFCDSGAVRLDAAAKAESEIRRARGKQNEGLRHPDLFTELDGIQHDNGPHGKTTQFEEGSSEPPATESILRSAFGSRFEEARSRVAREPANRRRAAWLQEYVAALKMWGATHVLSFSVVDEAEHHKYYLVHAATNAKAVVAMKDAIRSATKRRAQQAGTQTAMLYVSAIDIDEVMRQAIAHFRGRRVRWTDTKKGVDTLQQYLLRETDALHVDLPEIQERLKNRGYLIQSRPAIYNFP